MTTAMMNEQEIQVEYQEFTWQGVKALAKRIGVPFYSRNNYTRYGYGFKANRFDPTLIEISGYYYASGQNDHDSSMISRLGWENFKLTLELYSLKNNMKYQLVVPDRNSKNLFERAYIRIIK